MKESRQLKRVLVIIDEGAKWEGQNLAKALVARLKQEGIAGATVLHGTGGFGSHGAIHTQSILDLATSLPILIMFVDEPQRIDGVLPIFDEMISEGLVMVDDVTAYVHRSDGK